MRTLELSELLSLMLKLTQNNVNSVWKSFVHKNLDCERRTRAKFSKTDIFILTRQYCKKAFFFHCNLFLRLWSSGMINEFYKVYKNCIFYLCKSQATRKLHKCSLTWIDMKFKGCASTKLRWLPGRKFDSPSDYTAHQVILSEFTHPSEFDEYHVPRGPRPVNEKFVLEKSQCWSACSP